MEFEWDPKKAAINLRKHRVTFHEAASVFSDPLADVYQDPDHSTRERRFLIIGRSATGRLLISAFIERGDRIRLINSRPLTRREKKLYEEEERRRKIAKRTSLDRNTILGS
jgi:uncharacterized DUF497 family protein